MDRGNVSSVASKGEPYDSRRREIVERARNRWKEKLYDLGRRNNLLYFRDLKKGSLTLDGITESIGERLMAQEVVPLLDLAGDLQDRIQVLGKVREIRNRAVMNEEEKGLDTCYLAYGFASWRATDGGRNPSAPIWLLPVKLEPAGRDALAYSVRRTGDFILNPLLRYVLRTNFGIDISPGGLEEESLAVWPSLESFHVREQLIPEFAVEPRAVLSNFSFQKMAMVQDLDELGERLADNLLVSAMAGDAEAASALFAQDHGDETLDAALDQVSPEDEFSVLDADSSQQRVIRAVAAGRSGIVLGPPGTGKSQTIVNVIAECIARGRSVLFVAEKRAAIDVVLRRMQEIGLGALVLDLHAAEKSKQWVANQLAQSFTHIGRVTSVETQAVHERLKDRRERLNTYVRRLHEPRPPINRSFYDMQGVLVHDQAVRVATRWDRAVLNGWNSAVLQHVQELLRQLGELQGVYHTAWAGATFRDDEAVKDAIATVQRLRDRLWPEVAPHLEWAAQGTYAPVETLRRVGEWMSLFSEVENVLQAYKPSVYDLDLEALSAALAPGETGWFGHWMHRLFDREYQKAFSTLDAHRLAAARGKRPAGDLANIRRQREEWQRLGAVSAPETPPAYAEAKKWWDETWAAVMRLAQYGLPLADLSLAEFSAMVSQLAQDRVSPYQLRLIGRIHSELRASGLGALVSELEDRRMPLAEWSSAFAYALAASWVEAILAEDPVLQTFNRETHERYIEEFRAADREHLLLARQRVLRQQAERAVDTMNEYPEEATTVRSESQKRTRHMPVRRLLTTAPHVLLSLRPCWVASPLTVSQFLPPQELFDVVLFDEASQVLPEDAVTTIARGRQWVVAGDHHQLPPTTFFASGGDEDDEEGPPEGFESLLDLLAGMTAPWHLQWHYRSRDERLIAFANAHIYQSSLITFPGCGREAPITHVLVPQVMGSDRDVDSVGAEVERVVALILDHAQRHADESLGVITMGVKHADRIQLALEEALRERPDVDAFFAGGRPEPFFIKNLERVQGDERDAIIISIGYGKDGTGRLPFRFGPLLYDGGERRLNVAITRARRRMVVVSSFDHRDMDPSRCRSRGTQLLRAFLEYAATGGDSLRVEARAADVSLNPFEQGVYEALRARGLHLEPQWGVSSYRLDFAVAHPERPGEFVLAIECDGASYHSAPTARDRDRLRQQQLEALGWRFHRIWSTDWFRNPTDEIERVMHAYKEALEAGNLGRPHPSSPVPAAPAVREFHQATRVGPQPLVLVGRPIDDHSLEELVRLVRWIQSDGVLRTDEEIIHKMVPILGFKRRGPRIQERLKAAIAAWRSQENSRVHGR
ncbi:MAG: AAA domain-containing protein [Firmicutes bacterium]|nr:AAA domain-containing protein [Bacillota bacterium]